MRTIAGLFPKNAGAAVVVMAAGALLAAYDAGACDRGTVRDAAFQQPRDIHRLCLFTTGNSADDEAAGQLETWLAGAGAQLNLRLERVNAASPDVDWADYGIASAPPGLPVVALVSTVPMLRRAFLIDHWEPGPGPEDLAVLAESPVRRAIRDALVERWAVVLYAPPAGMPTVGAAVPDAAVLEETLAAVKRRWAGEQPPGIGVVRIDRSDPRERLLVSFIGLESPGPAWAGVVFGKGKLLAPPLEGEDLTEANLNDLLAQLAVPCTCLQQSMALGIDLPMAWDNALTARVVGLSGADGYTEVRIQPEPAGPLFETPDESRHALAAALVAAASAAAVACAAVGWAYWRARRRIWQAEQRWNG